MPAIKIEPMSAHAQKQMDELLTVKAKATCSISIAAELDMQCIFIADNVQYGRRSALSRG